jgi:predicted nucleotidyltransferase
MPTRSSGSVRIFSPDHSREEIIEELHASLPALRRQLPLRRLVLFGSQASGRAAVGSDVDVLVIYDDPPRDDAFAIVKKTIALRGVEPHLFTTSQAQERRDLIRRMTEDSVVIFD